MKHDRPAQEKNQTHELEASPKPQVQNSQQNNQNAKIQYRSSSVIQTIQSQQGRGTLSDVRRGTNVNIKVDLQLASPSALRNQISSITKQTDHSKFISKNMLYLGSSIIKNRANNVVNAPNHLERIKSELSRTNDNNSKVFEMGRPHMESGIRNKQQQFNSVENNTIEKSELTILKSRVIERLPLPEKRQQSQLPVSSNFAENFIRKK